MADAIFPTQLLRRQTDSQLSVYDLIINGEVPRFELPGGPIGMAIGAQRRNNGFDWKPSALYQSGDSTMVSRICLPTRLGTWKRGL